MFTDEEFPAEPNSIQKPGEEARCGVVQPDDWVRAPELLESLDLLNGEDVMLFNEIIPNDIAQGNTGDCWLLAAIAAYAEYPNGIQKLFESQTVAEDGQYTVKLFNFESDEWEDVTVDDLIPTTGGKPTFTTPQGNELWVIILEKAFAKFVGSYAAISGGNPGYAFMAFSGITDGLSYMPPSSSPTGAWLRLHHDPDATLQIGAKDCMGLQFMYGPQYGDGVYDVENMFQVMFEAYSNNYVAAVSWNNANNGLVAKHVYSFLGIYGDPENEHYLLAFRNPYAWNSDEWTGAWGDNSDIWEENPDLKEKLNADGGAADGCFWMSYEDFETNVEAVYLWPVEGLKRPGEGAMSSAKKFLGIEKPPIGAH